MAFETIKARWQGYSPAKKWLLGTAGVVFALGVAGAGEDQGTAGVGRWAQQQMGVMTASDDMPGTMGAYSGVGNPGAGADYAGSDQGSAAPAGYDAPSASSYAAQNPQPVDITSGYEAQQRSQDQSARAFGQYIRDETDVTDSSTGVITTNVPNDVAYPAIESGSYAATPAADVASATAAE